SLKSNGVRWVYPSIICSSRKVQGIAVLTLDGIDVKHPETMFSVSRDREILGEIMLKGNDLVRSKPGSTSTVVEFETIMYSHPLVTEAAVVAMSHPPWGKMPCAFLNTKSKIKEEDVISWPRKLKHCPPKVLMERKSYPKNPIKAPIMDTTSIM
ncbi:hypothetical protein KI387_040849, partial [Taxus chinensis]